MKRQAIPRELAVDYSILRALVAVVCCAQIGFGQRGLKEIPDPDPQLQLQELQVHPDFEINLFAADPRIAKPIQMNFDPQGRLWLASSEVYPQIEPGQEANDKILVLEDQDRDGVADTTTVFADGLLIPTGVIPGDGGAYVANSTELLHLTDNDEDGVADHERVMLSGFGTEDTHHILHTLRWGPDGLLYMNQSIYIHSHIETPYGVRRMNGAGVWHFRPETLELETFTLGLVNPWGHIFDPYGQSFETDGAGGEGINYVFPGFVGMTSPGARRILRGLNPGKPKLCGLEYIGGSHLPEDWRGDLITNDFRAHRVCRYKVTEDGAGFAAKELDELVKSRHQSFRPIDVKLGPDGAIYIADWYNPIIQHGEVDFRDPRRDHTHGRIWRITAKNRKPLPYKNLYDASVPELLDFLATEEPFYREQARRVLKERGKDAVLPAIKEKETTFENRARLELLWLYQSLNTVNEPLLRELLDHDDHKIRAAATRVLYHWFDRTNLGLKQLRKLATDEHPRVRLEASHALRQSDEAEAAFVALASLSEPTDRFLEFAMQQTADQSSENWIPALAKGSINVEDSKALLFALKSTNSPEAVPILLRALKDWPDDDTAIEDAMQLVAERGEADDLAVVFQRSLDDATSTNTRAALLSSLISANRKRKVKPSGELGELAQVVTSNDPAVQSAAAELAGLWALPEIKQPLAEIASDESAEAGSRVAAIRGLAAMQDAEILEEIASQKVTPNDVRVASVAGINQFDNALAAKSAAAYLAQMRDEDDPSSLLKAMLGQDGGDNALRAALTNVQIPSRDIAKLAIRAARTSGRDVTSLVEQLRRSSGLGQEVKFSEDDQEKLLRDANASGDPARGEDVYRRPELNCQKCHAIGGAGGKVGPDIASIGSSAPADYILQSLLDPSAKIKENYHSQIVATDEGQVIAGVLVRETDTSLLLRDAEDNEISIPLDSIEERKDGGSLMPAGLLNDLTRKELVDLVRFLSELGKVGPYATPSSTLVRTWQTLPASTDLEDQSEEAIAANDDLPWRPIYSRVNGTLPQAELPVVNADGRRMTILRFPLEMNNAGKKTIKLLHASNDIRLYLDGKRLKSANMLELDLDRGTHHVVIASESIDQDTLFAVLLD